MAIELSRSFVGTGFVQPHLVGHDDKQGAGIFRQVASEYAASWARRLDQRQQPRRNPLECSVHAYHVFDRRDVGDDIVVALVRKALLKDAVSHALDSDSLP